VWVPTNTQLIGERVTLLDVADVAMGDIRERGQFRGETVVDCAAALEGAIRHQLGGVLGIQIHDAVEITRVVQLDIALQETSVDLHGSLLSLPVVRRSDPVLRGTPLLPTPAE
jgi:hypothetical protein